MRVRKKAVYTSLCVIVLLCILGPVLIHKDAEIGGRQADSKLNRHKEAFNVREKREGMSYVFALSYMEQTANAIINLFQLGKGFKSRLVIPSVHGSRMFGLPNYNPMDNSSLDRSMSDYVDIEAISTKGCNVSMSSFEEFLALSHREIVLLHPVKRADFDRITVDDYQNEKYFVDFLPPAIEDELRGCIQKGPCPVRTS
jgi:hypothetical protein